MTIVKQTSKPNTKRNEYLRLHVRRDGTICYVPTASDVSGMGMDREHFNRTIPLTR